MQSIRLTQKYRVLNLLRELSYLSFNQNSYGDLSSSYLQSYQRYCSQSDQNNESQDERISVIFIEKDGQETKITVPVGQQMLEAAHSNEIELEGACEGSLACSTCHVIVEDEAMYNKLPEPTDDENDMLDLAFGLTHTSRLGCQVVATKELDGLRLKLPMGTVNVAVDGYVPKPH